MSSNCYQQLSLSTYSPETYVHQDKRKNMFSHTFQVFKLKNQIYLHEIKTYRYSSFVQHDEIQAAHRSEVTYHFKFIWNTNTFRKTSYMKSQKKCLSDASRELVVIYCNFYSCKLKQVLKEYNRSGLTHRGEYMLLFLTHSWLAAFRISDFLAKHTNSLSFLFFFFLYWKRLNGNNKIVKEVFYLKIKQVIEHWIPKFKTHIILYTLISEGIANLVKSLCSFLAGF